jgi:hypothetical protein
MLRSQPVELSPESQAFYHAWFEQHYSEEPDELQVLEQLWDLDQRLMAFLAPAFSPRGAPARDVLRVMRAVLLLLIKNLRSENQMVKQELKNNVLYRWFVRLELNQTISQAFRLRMVRLRARIMTRLGPERLQAFLAQTVELARRCAASPASLPLGSEPAAATPASDPCQVPATAEPTTDAPVPPPRPTVTEISPGRVTFDLTPAQGRARIVPKRDNPQPTIPAPLSAGDPDCYWIKKKRPGGQTEVRLGYEVGLFSDWHGGLITGVVVRRQGEQNKLKFSDWVDDYQRAWQLGPGELTVSTDREFFTGEILRHGEQQQQRLLIPSVTIRPRQGKLDHHYFTYFPDEDLWVCHEGAELKRVSYDAKKKGTRYQAPARACDGCPTATVCKSGKGPRRLFRSDFAPEVERARQRQPTPEFQQARRAQWVMGEGSFAHGNCLHGLDRARYYGSHQMLVQSYLTAWAMNLKKACRWALSKPTRPAMAAAA